MFRAFYVASVQSEAKGLYGSSNRHTGSSMEIDDTVFVYSWSCPTLPTFAPILNSVACFIEPWGLVTFQDKFRELDPV
eukprot:4908594-Amphidinium_carterae.1